MKNIYLFTPGVVGQKITCSGISNKKQQVGPVYLNAKRIFLSLILLIVIISGTAFGQVSSYSFTQASGTYTEITGGTILGTEGNDEDVFGGLNIGFPFVYNNVSYTQFGLNVNGWISLGPGTPGESYTPITTINNVISALANDLIGKIGSSIQYSVTGYAPNRTLVIQWTKYQRYDDYNLPNDDLNFQIRLNESTNSIQIVYGAFIVANTKDNTVQVGLRGTGRTDYNNRLVDGTHTWAESTAGTSNSSSCLFQSTACPYSGLTYSWTPPVPTITLSSPSQVAPGNIMQGATNAYLSVFQAAATIGTATLNSLTFASAGDYQLTDLANFKLYYNTSNTFPGGTPLATLTTSLGTGTHTFTGLTQTIARGATGYFWITGDVNSDAIPGRTIYIAANPTLTFTAVTPTGSIAAGGTQTIVVRPTILTDNISGSPFCAGTSVITVPFRYDPPSNFPNSTTSFTAQLSNDGFTSNITTLQSVESDGTGTQSISVTIPTGTAAGLGYRIRVVSNNPAINGSDNGTNISVNTSGIWIGGTSTDWNNPSNWCGGSVPIGTDVTITSLPSNQPVVFEGNFAVCNNLTIDNGASLTINGTANITTLTINAGGTMTVNEGVQASITTLINNGTINLNSSSAGIFSLLMNSYSGTGTANVQLYLTGGGTKPYWKWHYVAVPVDGLSTAYFTDINSFNLRAYNDSRVKTSDFNGWSWWDGFGGTPGIEAGGGFTTLSYGKGYLFWNGSDATVNFANMPSLGTTLGTVSLQYSGGSNDPTIYGYNLLGNSLTCSLNWDNVSFSGSVGQTVYYTTGNLWASYLKGATGTNGATKYIPPLQGFFVKADATGASVNFSNAKTYSTQQRYKKSGTEQAETNEEKIYPKVKLELNGNQTSDETIVWFNDEASYGYDRNFDGLKLFPEADFGQLYSTLSGKNFVINGISLPVDSTIVPLSVKIAQAGSYSLLKKVLEELDDYDVFLIDKANGNYTVDLKNADKYTFSSDAGTFENRFVLKFVSLVTSAEPPSVKNKNFNIYATTGSINILPSDEIAGTSNGVVKIYDLTGRIVKQDNSIGLYGGTLVQIPFAGRQGIYIVEISSGAMRNISKVSVK